MATTRRAAVRRTAGLLAAALLAAAAIAVGACSRSPREEAAPATGAPSGGAAPASLMLVTLDTFRADASGCGGDPGARTPYLDRLARSGIQFRNGLAPAPITRPSHASMLTGVTPPRHGIRDNGLYGLAPGVPTLAESLQARGFATGAFIAAFPLDSQFGLDKGFDHYDDVLYKSDEIFTESKRDGDEVTRVAAEWLRSVPPERPVFAFVHLFDAHAPPNAPAPVMSLYDGDSYRADVWTADHWLGRAAWAARERGGFRIIVLGDHGESRGDHHEPTHGVFVYGSTMRVPAVIWPASAGRKPGLRDAVFRAIDVPATAFALLGLPPADAPGEGADALEDGPRPTYMESLYSAIEYGWAELHAIQDDGWKYVRAPEPELYDLRADPGETHNVIDEHPERAAALAARLDSMMTEEVAGTTVQLDDAAREALESLGYAGGGGPEPGEEGADDADRPDPKRMISIQNNVTAAQGLLADGQPDAALALLRRALARDPHNKGIYLTMGIAAAQLGKHDVAVDYFLRCIELPPHRNDRAPRFELASSYIYLGEYDKAIAQLEKVVEVSPEDAPAWYNLGTAQDRAGRHAKAREAWQRSLQADPNYKLARDALGQAAP